MPRHNPSGRHAKNSPAPTSARSGLPVLVRRALVGGLVLLAVTAVYLGWSARPGVDAGRTPTAAASPTAASDTARDDRPDRSLERPDKSKSATSAAPDTPRPSSTAPAPETARSTTPDDGDDQQSQRVSTPRQSTEAKLDRSSSSAEDSETSTPTRTPSTSTPSPTLTPKECESLLPLDKPLKKLRCLVGDNE